MGKYTELAAGIIENIGGRENVKDLTHCVTRLRFYLFDASRANDEAIKGTDGVVSVVKAMGQYMVVIGEHVGDVYEEVCAQLGRQGEAAQKRGTTQTAPEEKKGLLDRVLGVIMAAMGPTLNLLCACGIVKGLLVVATMLGLSADSGMYALLNAAGDCLFYSLPLILGFNVAKKFEIDPFFGLLLGAALTYPTIQGVDLNFFGYVVNVTYTSSFLPVLFGLIFAIPLYKWLDRHIHKLLRGFLTPMITLLVAFPLTFLIIGPLANLVGTGINYGLNFLFELSPILGGAVLGGMWQLMVMFGVHGIPMMFAFYDLLAGNPSVVLAMVGTVNFAVCGTLLTVVLRSREDQLKSAGASSMVSAFLGVTEPAMYGIIVPRKKLLAATCIGGAAGGLTIGLFGLKMYTYAGMGIVGMLGYLNPEGANVLGILVAIVVPFVVALAVSMAMYKEDGTDGTVAGKPANGAEGGKTADGAEAGQKMFTVRMPVDGTVRSMSAASDEVFAAETLGKGCVILPDNGKVYAPVSGTVCTLFPTKHAIGMVSEDGVEILIHIGINTVALEGRYFEEKIRQGDTVKVGQLLMSFDKGAIEEAGYSTEIPLVITNSGAYLDVVEIDHEHHGHGEEIIKIIG